MEASGWCVITVRFKFLAGGRGGGGARDLAGFTFAQNDLIVITCAYPVFLAAVWSVGYCSMVLHRRQVAVWLPLISAATVTLGALARVQGLGLHAALCLHLGIQVPPHPHPPPAARAE